MTEQSVRWHRRRSGRWRLDVWGWGGLLGVIWTVFETSLTPTIVMHHPEGRHRGGFPGTRTRNLRI